MEVLRYIWKLLSEQREEAKRLDAWGRRCGTREIYKMKTVQGPGHLESWTGIRVGHDPAEWDQNANKRGPVQGCLGI
jgi:hypothetical protein